MNKQERTYKLGDTDIRMRDERLTEVEIVADLEDGLLVTYRNSQGRKRPITMGYSGKLYSDDVESPYDLLPKPKMIEIDEWRAVFSRGDGTGFLGREVYETKDECRRCNPTAAGIVHIDTSIPEGEGLND